MPRDIIFLSNINMAIDDLQRIIANYTEAQLKFSAGVYESGNGDVFESNGCLDTYQQEIRDILDLLQKQLEYLQRVRQDLKDQI